jgi:DNA-binding MarR family transcriptional regulator
VTSAAVADRFLVLHVLRLKGLASTEGLAEATGLSDGSARDIAARLAEEELARYRDGRMNGYSLTAAGKAAHAEALADDIADEAVRTAVAGAYEDFVALNGRFKQACTDWQTKRGGDETVTNDHGDADYDAAVIEQLAAVHAAVVPMLETLSAALPRFGRYRDRLTAALDRVRTGEPTALAKPMSNSYHDIWMELHQDLLTSGERQRDERDEG